MSLSADHIRRMQAGRKRGQLAQTHEAISRVQRFEAWLKAGSVLKDIPCVPSDMDYAMARKHGKVDR